MFKGFSFMYQKKIAVIILLFIGFSCYSQQNVRNYYDLINRAELHICEDNYNEASALYEKAFELLESPFYVDVHNAFVCACYLKKPNIKLIELSKILYKKSNGSFDFIDTNICANKDEIIKVLKEIPINLDLKLIHVLDSLQSEDSKARCKCVAYKPECINDIRYIDSLNREKLYSLYKEYGELTEDIAGYSLYSRLHVLGIHNQMWCYDVISEFVEPMVHKGLFDAREYLKIIDRQQHYPKCNFESKNFAEYDFHVKDSVLFVMGVDEENKKIINENRKAFYLDNIDDYTKKTLYRILHKEFIMGAFTIKFVTGGDEKTECLDLIKKIDNGTIIGTKYFLLRKD